MAHRVKTLGLALAAVLAVSAVVTSAASATIDAFVAESVPVTLTGTQHNGTGKFTLAGQSAECTTVKTTSTLKSVTLNEYTSQESELSELSGCTYAGQPATVTLNGCHLLLTGATDANGHVKTHVQCPPGNKAGVTLNAIKCLVTIGPQEAEEGYAVTTTGVGTTRELTLHITAKVKTTADADPSEGVTCASLTNGSGTFSGTAIVTGEEDKAGGAAHVGITDETLLGG